MFSDPKKDKIKKVLEKKRYFDLAIYHLIFMVKMLIEKENE